MIEIDLPDHPGSPTVRGLAACLASVTELPLDVLPQPPADAPVSHAIAAWKTWLAGRDFGMVPVADPGSFQWAGYWIALVDQPDGQGKSVV